MANTRVLNEKPDGIVVTGVTKNHFEEAYGMVRTAQRYIPTGWKIIIFDILGDWNIMACTWKSNTGEMLSIAV